MSNLAVIEGKNALASQDFKMAISKAVLEGDLSKLTPEQKTSYYNAVCYSMGLNPATQPFTFMNFEARDEWINQDGKKVPGKPGKEVLYPNHTCAQQLRSRRGVSLSGPDIKFDGSLIMVKITAKTRDGREDTDYGIVDTKTGKDSKLSRADAILKAITKAKRRVTFSILGLGYLDAIAESVENGIDPELISVEVMEEPSLSQLHGVEYMTSENFAILSDMAIAAGLSKDLWGRYLRHRYPNRTRGEIPVEDFDAIADDLSDEEKLAAIVLRFTEPDGI